MNFCVHHTDDDGLCAAAIVKNELDTYGKMQPNNFIPYNYEDEVIRILPREFNDDEPEFYPGSTIYFVDLSLSARLIRAFDQCLKKGIKIVHIDHHQSTIDFMKDMNQHDKDTMSKVVHLYDTKYSGAMLTWFYACMGNEEREHPEDVWYDTTDTRSHVKIGGEESDREYRIPMGLRFIDDYDIWRHQIPGTKQFHSGFKNVKKDPCEAVWVDILYSTVATVVDNCVYDGEKTIEVEKNMYATIMKNSYEIDLSKYLNRKKPICCLCVNSPFHSSDVFGDFFEKYPVVCAYHRNNHGEWTYSFYSHEKSRIDCSKVAKTFDRDGGGHKHAAGCHTKELML